MFQKAWGFLKRWRKVGMVILLLLGVAFYYSLPEKLFKAGYSFVLTDRNGQLLQARISEDGQWRFPYSDSIPARYEQALLLYEDRHFYSHPGVDPLALTRAVKQNLSARKTVSGGSTLSMQVIRLSRGKKQRNLGQKILELILAIRLECRYSKKEILHLYAGHAPFGGNVVGLNAASWRYFGRSPHDLSWAEMATLAVLPNSPALIHPGRNRKALKAKRNRLLDKLFANHLIDEETNQLSKLEDIPEKPVPLPQLAPHLINSLQSGKIGFPISESQTLRTTIDAYLQQQVAALLLRHHQQLRGNSINNAAALVMEVESGHVLAYVGNVYQPAHPEFDSQVDVITAPRSPGSTLKPFLYEAMLTDGLILPKTLVPDIPTQIAGYTPKNFDLGYDGAVPAARALSRSLNIPAVRMLQQYRVERFYSRLKKLGVTTLHAGPDHYGLSLILGGGENNLWELAGMYGSMARVLSNYRIHNGKYDPDDIHPPLVTTPYRQPEKKKPLLPSHLFQAASVYQTFEAMEEVMRPGEELLWQQFASAQRIAWKTGTSFGFRDGWAIGVTPQHVVAVWVGNADGEGRPGLIGVETAAPILFEIFRLLPNAKEWFSMPYAEMVKVPICKKSGYRAHAFCLPTDSAWIPVTGLKTPACPYHQLVHLNDAGTFRVNGDCYPIQQMQHRNWFVLPPVMEWYYKSRNPDYAALPAWLPSCSGQSAASAMEMIYPKKSNRVFIPVELDGKTGKCIFEVAHRQGGARIHWHLDEVYLGTTDHFHQMALSPSAGKHTLTLIDDAGERLEQGFDVIPH